MSAAVRLNPLIEGCQTLAPKITSGSNRAGKGQFLRTILGRIKILALRNIFAQNMVS